MQTLTENEVKAYEQRIAELEAELHGTVTTKYHDEIVNEAVLRLLESRAENQRLREALQSIANNTCCEPCQEAKLVAKAALLEVGK
jgi:tRNA(Phe) wybutosine-synthesizing methylase Tyw3